MKIEINNQGWTETVTTNIKIESFHKNPFNTTVKDWIKSNERLRLKKGMRSHCSCCHTSWKLLSGNINLVMTNKGNKVVCDECFDKLVENK